MTDKIEKEIQEKASVAPRVTPARIEEVIAFVDFFTAEDGVMGAFKRKANPEALLISGSLSLLTFCVITLKNGFTVTGESACASPENFNEEIGQKIAYENAKNKIWQLEGYLLKENLSK